MTTAQWQKRMLEQTDKLLKHTQLQTVSLQNMRSEMEDLSKNVAIMPEKILAVLVEFNNKEKI